MKKIALLCLSPLVLANMAFAGGYAGWAPRFFNGFTAVGAFGGMLGELQGKQQVISFVEVTETVDAVEDTASSTFTGSTDLELFESSLTGYIGLDYAYQFYSGWVLGAGVTAGFNNLKFNNTAFSLLTFGNDDVEVTNKIESTLEVKLENDFALLFKTGFVVRHNTLIYALVGPRWGNINTSLESVESVKGSSDIFPPWKKDFNGSDDNAEYQLGVTAGVGLKQMVSGRVSIGFEYAYTHYGDLDSVSVPYSFHETSTGRGVSTLDLSGSDTYDDSQLTTHAVMATLSYRF